MIIDLNHWLQVMDKEEDNWLPLESNPKVMTQFIKDLGVNT